MPDWLAIAGIIVLLIIAVENELIARAPLLTPEEHD
jgi:hypothetical protein